MSCDLLVLPVAAELNLCSETFLLAFEGLTPVSNGASSAFGCIRVLSTLRCRSTSSRSVPALSRAWGYGCGRAKAPSAVLGWGTWTQQSISGIYFISPRKTFEWTHVVWVTPNASLDPQVPVMQVVQNQQLLAISAKNN